MDPHRVSSLEMPPKPLASVLVVDPAVMLHEQVGAMLQGLFEVRYATTAAEARAALERRPPDLLVLEVDLPDANGLELCEQLRADPATQRLPILILTARGSIQEKVAGFQAGADDYLVKPPSQRFFSSRLRLLLRIKELQKKSYNGSEGPTSSPPAPPSSDQ
jgi:two-component system phosphate regulon response regulator OmpR